MRRHLASALTLAVMVSLPAGCATKAQTGEETSAVIGNATGSTVRGAIIGAAVGGITGAAIGQTMDQQAGELANDLRGATVQRFREGITVTFPDGLLFGLDSDQVTPAARDNLRLLAASLKKYPDTRALIVGHTDSQGRDGYNMGLSMRRAAAAASFMETEGLDRIRVRTAGRGETEPVATNGSDAGRSQNRRLEMAIFATPASTVGAAN